MSTRYVWDVYDVTDGIGIIDSRDGFSMIKQKTSTYYLYMGDSLFIENGSCCFIVTDKYKITPNKKLYVPAGKYFDMRINDYNIGESGTFAGHQSDSQIEVIYRYSDGQSYDYVDFYSSSLINIWNIINTKGELIKQISSAKSYTYPTDGKSGLYWYTRKGSDSIDPIAITYPSSIKGGQSITLNTTKSSKIEYGGTITYTYEVQLDGGAWTTIGDSTSLTKSYTVPAGTTTFRARVKARDNLGFTSTTYKTGSQVTVVNNVAPVISGSNQNLGVFTYNPPTISYVVTDENNDTVTVTIKLDSSTLESRTVTLGQTYTVPIKWWDIRTGSHTVTITANDGQEGTATRTYTFTKNSVGQISFNRLHKKISSRYQTTYIETDSDSIITNNGQVLSERLSDIASKLSTTINTTPTEMVSRHRLHIKLTSEYTIDYLEMYSTNIKVGSSILESILTQLESKVGITNSGTAPSNLNFERWRMKNNSGGYDIIYLESISEYIIRPCGKTVEESLQAIESKL